MEATLSLPEKTQAGQMTGEELCRVYAVSVCRFAAIVTRNAADAEDLAQDALLRAVRSLRTYDASRGSVESWLWRIVTNASRDAASRRERVRDLVVRLRVLAPRETETVEDAALARLRDSELHAELRRLPWRDRALARLRARLLEVRP
ncbi:MAG TPA: sigma-70 family RNA polymerase sigma factor [Candidatus Dormibacteraeota bacterium]|nr:sigma-70 family RNA polymerase sigma factor [Candidatus Dormibacteraeota bacterium]